MQESPSKFRWNHCAREPFFIHPEAIVLVPTIKNMVADTSVIKTVGPGIRRDKIIETSVLSIRKYICILIRVYFFNF